MSEHDTRPKEVIEKEKLKKELEEIYQKESYAKMLIGKLPDKRSWQQYIKIKDKLKQIGNGESHSLFKREPYIEPILLLARQMRNDEIFGKEIFKLHSKPLGTTDKYLELGGTKKPLRTIF